MEHMEARMQALYDAADARQREEQRLLAEAVAQIRAHQQQLDADGVHVGVSRQALELVLDQFPDSCTPPFQADGGGSVTSLQKVQGTPADNTLQKMQIDLGELQNRVAAWMLACFNPWIAADILERCDRFIEEAFELVQALGYDEARIAMLRDYVWGRPAGESSQEVGGVVITLAALCGATAIDMAKSGWAELIRIERPEIMAKIREKQATKPTNSPLPMSPLISTVAAFKGNEVREADVRWLQRQCPVAHCGEGHVERQHRYEIAERIERIVAALPTQAEEGR